MAANVETKIWEERTAPWTGLGRKITEARTSKEALELAGLDWQVLQEPIYTGQDELIPGYKANVRDQDHKVLGIVTEKYKVVQNEQAFGFTDALLEEGVRYETAGVLQDGKRVWMLCKLQSEYIISGERISPFLVIVNSHDSSSALKIALLPLRIRCSNMLNLALKQAKRSWSTIHAGEVKKKMDEAKNTLFMAEKYMDNLGKEFEALRMKNLTDKEVVDYIDILLPTDNGATIQQVKNINRLKEDIKRRYFDAPDLQDVGKNAYRFINSIADFCGHCSPLRQTENYWENQFARNMEGNPLMDKAYQMVCAA